MPQSSGNKEKICFVTAIPKTAEVFLLVHLEKLAGDFELYILSNFSLGVPPSLTKLAHCIHIPIQRHISFFTDLEVLIKLYWIMRRHSFSLVQSVTPKAGLLAIVAAWAAGIKYRIHWFTGQVWATRRGLSRALLKRADWLTASVASGLLADSYSQRQFLVKEYVCNSRKISVIANGSICGVDTERFIPNPKIRSEIRQRLAIPEAANVILFLGRLTHDKGLNELIEAAPLVYTFDTSAYFLFVGPDEGGFSSRLQNLGDNYPDRLQCIGYTDRPEDYMASADLFCLPSYREGFGNVIIEAASAGIPAVATKIYGLTDAIEDEQTGILVPVNDANALADALLRLTKNPLLREKMGRRARMRAVQHFSSALVAKELADYYADRLNRD